MSHEWFIQKFGTGGLHQSNYLDAALKATLSTLAESCKSKIQDGFEAIGFMQLAVDDENTAVMRYFNYLVLQLMPYLGEIDQMRIDYTNRDGECKPFWNS